MKFILMFLFFQFAGAGLLAQGTVTITGQDLNPSFSPDTSVPIVNLSFSAIAADPVIMSIKVDRTGTATNTDVPTASLWRDLNKNNIIDEGDIQLVNIAWFQGTETQSAIFQYLNYSPSTSENLLIVYNVAAEANINNTAGATIPAGYITGGNLTTITYLGTTTGENSLPVDLITFTAFAKNQIVNLAWETATEISNYGFEIQRSTVDDYKQGSEVWRKIGFVNGVGNSNFPHNYSFEDSVLLAGKFKYRLKQIDLNGLFKYSNTLEIMIDSPTKLILYQNFPNPFNPVTKINWQASVSGWQTLKIYDLLGRDVATLVNEYKKAGKYEVDFNASNLPTGWQGLSSGIYIYRLIIRSDNLQGYEYVNDKKMILIK